MHLASRQPDHQSNLRFAWFHSHQNHLQNTPITTESPLASSMTVASTSGVCLTMTYNDAERWDLAGGEGECQADGSES